MTSARPYRRQIGVKQALAELRRHAGTKFDEAVVEAFCCDIALRHNFAAETEASSVASPDAGHLTGQHSALSLWSVSARRNNVSVRADEPEAVL